MTLASFREMYPGKRMLEDYRDFHKGEEIYVMGTGNSLDDFPEGYFDDKLTIAVNGAFWGWPKCTYVHYWCRIFTDFMVNHAPNFFGKFILPHSIQHIGNPLDLDKRQKRVPYDFLDWINRPLKIEGDTLRVLNEWKKENSAEVSGNLGDMPIYMLWNGHPHSTEEQFQKAVDLIMQRKPAPYCKREPMVHTAVQAAVVMGADRVTLVGCEHEWSKSTDIRDCHAKKLGWFYGTYINAKADTGHWPGQQNFHRDGTRWLAQMFGKYGIKVRRYFYDKKNKFFEDGYREIK